MAFYFIQQLETTLAVRAWSWSYWVCAPEMPCLKLVCPFLDFTPLRRYNATQTCMASLKTSFRVLRPDFRSRGLLSISTPRKVKQNKRKHIQLRLVDDRTYRDSESNHQSLPSDYILPPGLPHFPITSLTLRLDCVGYKQYLADTPNDSGF